jgi:peptidoglycan/xylan/chitin deacetylase (PgdA/CDA1 family)
MRSSNGLPRGASGCFGRMSRHVSALKRLAHPLALCLLSSIASASCSSAQHVSRPPTLAAGLGAATASPTAVPATQSSTPVPGRYEVKAGDTLGLLARRFGTTVGAIQKLNGLNTDSIATGQLLQIPSSPTPAPSAVLRTPVADQSPAEPVYRGRTDTNAVALTFDAGADVGFTRLILDTLKRNGVRATFGMTGQWAQDNPALLKEMAGDGHAFINHSWDHQSFTGLSTNTKPLDRAERWSEVDRTEDIIRALTGKAAAPYFRSPFGDQDRSVEADVGSRGYRYDILWTVDTGGWAKASVGQIIATSAKGAAPGSIIVMHVGAESQDGPALQSIIDAIRQKGLGFATIPELVGAH